MGKRPNPEGDSLFTSFMLFLVYGLLMAFAIWLVGWSFTLWWLLGWD